MMATNYTAPEIFRVLLIRQVFEVCEVRSRLFLGWIEHRQMRSLDSWSCWSRTLGKLPWFPHLNRRFRPFTEGLLEVRRRPAFFPRRALDVLFLFHIVSLGSAQDSSLCRREKPSLSIFSCPCCPATTNYQILMGFGSFHLLPSKNNSPKFEVPTPVCSLSRSLTCHKIRLFPLSQPPPSTVRLFLLDRHKFFSQLKLRSIFDLFCVIFHLSGHPLDLPS